MLSNQNSMVLAQKYTHRSVEQNRESRNKSRFIHQLIYNKGGRIHNGERQALQYMVLRKLDRYMQKNQTGILFIPCTKVNSKWNHRLWVIQGCYDF